MICSWKLCKFHFDVFKILQLITGVSCQLHYLLKKFSVKISMISGSVSTYSKDIMFSAKASVTNDFISVSANSKETFCQNLSQHQICIRIQQRCLLVEILIINESELPTILFQLKFQKLKKLHFYTIKTPLPYIFI